MALKKKKKNNNKRTIFFFYKVYLRYTAPVHNLVSQSRMDKIPGVKGQNRLHKHTTKSD